MLMLDARGRGLTFDFWRVLLTRLDFGVWEVFEKTEVDELTDS